eukprot:67693-Amphidinium_carterae.1
MEVINQIKGESANNNSDGKDSKKKEEESGNQTTTTVTIQLGQEDELSVKVLKRQKVSESAFSMSSVTTPTAAAAAST